MKTSTMKKIIAAFVIILIGILIVIFSGCETSLGVDPQTDLPQITPSPQTEKILKQVDTIAMSMPVLVEGIEKALETPAGKLLPEQIKGIVQIAGFGAMSLSSLILYLRKNLFKKAMTEIAYSNKILIDENPELCKHVKAAEAKALNPDTLKLLKKEGLI